MEFDQWTEQVTKRLNEHKAAIAELCGICKEMAKQLDALGQKQTTRPGGD